MCEQEQGRLRGNELWPMAPRLDHYMCGRPCCDCEDEEGWCEDVWEDKYVRPIKKGFDEWKKQHLTDNFEASMSLSEKGVFYVILRNSEKEENPETDEKKSTQKRTKIEND